MVGVTTTVGDEDGGVTPEALTEGVVIVVGALGGVEVPLLGGLVTIIVPEEVGGVGLGLVTPVPEIVTPVPEIIVVGGVGAVVGTLVGVVIMVPMILVGSDKMLERRLPSPVLLVVAAATEVTGIGVVTGGSIPVEAVPVTPVGVGVSVEVGGRIALVTTERIDDSGFVPTIVVGTAETGGVGVLTTGGVVGVLTTGGVVGALTTVGVAIGVEVAVNGSRILVKMLLSGKIGAGLEGAETAVELEAAGVAVDPPLPENVTPDVRAELVVGLGGLDVVPPVKIPPGRNVIPLGEAEDADDGISTVVAATLSGVEGVGKINRGGTAPGNNILAGVVAQHW
ncbi:hypothetical protein N431DRAFT_20245 [Stipitochalara longipes BDJ]|nr:hypothetical protein N431DRAFT_20245 [Stipitochalara longipes BDJ]